MTAAFDRYWFAPASLRDLALVRMALFAGQALVFLWLPGGHPRTIAEQIRVAEVGTAVYDPILTLKLLLLPFGSWGQVQPGPTFLTVTYVVAAATGVLAAIGLFARISMLLCAAASALLVAHWYSYGEFHHAEALMAIALAVIAISPAAAVWSVDAALRRRRDKAPASAYSAFARWPLRLMQWLVALSYLSAAYAKLHVGGLAWFNGHTMTHKFAFRTLNNGGDLAFFLASLPPAWHIPPSIAAVLIELTFVVAVLWSRGAWIWIVGGILFHIGVYLTMGIAFFQTMLLYIVFIESLRRYPPWPVRARTVPPAPLESASVPA